MERTRTSAFCFSEASSEKIDVRDGALEVAVVPAEARVEARGVNGCRCNRCVIRYTLR